MLRNRRMTTFLGIAAALAIVLAGASVAQATTFFGFATGNFATVNGTVWYNSSSYPGHSASTDTAKIGGSASPTVTLNTVPTYSVANVYIAHRDTTYTSTYYGNGGLTISSGGNLTVTGTTYIGYSGTGTYNGTLTMNGGSLNLGSGGLARGGTAAQATFKLASGTVTAGGSFTYGGAVTLTGSAGVINTGTGSYNVGLSNAIGDGGGGYGFTTAGNGTLTLSGTNTYTGATTVSAGTLYLNGGAISTSSDIQVANGATYQVLVSSATSVSLYSRLATTDPSANKLNLVGSIINQNVSYTLGGSNVTMQWRARTNTEVSLGLASDVMTLGGVTAGTPYVADMYYNPASLLGPGAPTLAYNPSDSIWVNAVNGNTGNNASGGELGYVGSFAAFQTWVGDTNIADYVGAYGYDPGTDQAWAVVNQAGGSFAVVPEPGTLAMLAVGLLGMVAYGWRKRK